jgi:hypothetical protein
LLAASQTSGVFFLLAYSPHPKLSLPSHTTSFSKFMTSDENYRHHKREISKSIDPLKER